MPVLLIAGLLVYLMVFADIIYTVFSARGAGTLTSTVSQSSWRLLLWLSKAVRKPSFLEYAGVIIICVILLKWLLLIWLANILMVASSDVSILNSDTKAPATFWEKVYVTGYIISSLGNGDYMGGSTVWKLYIAVASFTGIIAITLSITYLVPVLSAVTRKKQLSYYIFSLGSNPEELLLNGWNGTNFSRLDNPLQTITQEILSLSEAHLSYPVLHFFYSSRLDKASVPSLVKLDEAIGILNRSIPAQTHPDALTLQAARKALDAFLDNLNGMVKPSSTTPPLPDLKSLKQKGIPLLPAENKLPGEEERRRLLLGLLEYEGRSWQHVYS